MGDADLMPPTLDPPGSAAFNVGAKLPPSVIFSCYANSAELLWAVRQLPKPWPAIIDIQGEVPPGGKGHPSWKPVADRSRDASGRLLPNLISRYPQAQNVERIGVVGFSAGSNSGVREFLRHPADREAISFVACIDGLHPIMNWQTGQPYSWEESLGPTAAYALSAAKGKGMCIITGNNLAAPSAETAQTPWAMRAINARLTQALGAELKQHPADMSVIQAFRAGKTVKPGTAQAQSPAFTRGPTPNGEGGIGNTYFFEYPGTQKADHIAQARVVLPLVVNTFLRKYWTGTGPDSQV